MILGIQIWSKKKKQFFKLLAWTINRSDVHVFGPQKPFFLLFLGKIEKCKQVIFFYLRHWILIFFFLILWALLLYAIFPRFRILIWELSGYLDAVECVRINDQTDTSNTNSKKLYDPTKNFFDQFVTCQLIMLLHDHFHSALAEGNSISLLSHLEPVFSTLLFVDNFFFFGICVDFEF